MAQLPVRRFLRIVFPVVTALLLVGHANGDLTSFSQSSCDPLSNAIACENQLQGNPSSEWDVSGAGDSTIQGFATDISVNHGDIIHFKIDTNANAYRIDIYRLGYYGGMGARKIATVLPSVGLPQVQPDCITDLATGLIDCGNWTESAAWAVPASATSGVYIARLVRTDTGGASHVPFVVRNDQAAADLVFQTSDTTWQAYNTYGGNSLYVGGPGTSPGRAYKVSYNRPFTTRATSPEDFLFNAEYPMIRWLEANGYGINYISGLDTDRSGASELLRYKAFLSVGHDEYWSGPQRANVEAARAAGVNLAFFSGNEVFWKTRWSASIDGTSTPFRTLVSYKETHANAKIDPTSTWTGTWRDPRFSPPSDGGRPENALTGTLFTVNVPPSTSNAIVVTGAFRSQPFWRNTRIASLAANGSTTLSAGTLGYEWDENVNNGSRPAGLTTLSTTTLSAQQKLQDYGSTYAAGSATHSLTLYTHASGAMVFGAGTVQWSWGLDGNHDRGGSTSDVAMQQATVNLLSDMGAEPWSLQSGLVRGKASSDTIAPTSTITSPASGSVLTAGAAVTVSGTTGDTGGGHVSRVEVSVNGGSTWSTAAGTTSWSLAWTPVSTGSVTVRSRAIDDSGNQETPSAGVSVTVLARSCPCTIWPTSAVPSRIETTDKSSVEVGVKFSSDLAGTITGIRFYKGSTNTGTHTGSLWSASGTRLATATFANETTSGWQQLSFASPVTIAANTVYVASYHANTGNYGADSNYFLSAFDNAPLHARVNATGNGNGVYIYGASAFPTQTYQASNYWVDVVFQPTAPDTTAPAVTITSPANNATVAGSTVTIAASASDAGGIAGVQFLLDGVALSAEDTTSPYGLTWNSTSVPNGAHTLTARARDTSGNVATSNEATITVANDATAPTISMSSPVGGAVVSGSTISVSATASDDIGIAGVQFLLDNAVLGTEDTTSPFGIVWDTTTVSNGPHTLSAHARDAAGNITTSATVSITVANQSSGVTLESTVLGNQNASSSTVTTTSFSPAAGRLLLALISGGWSSGTTSVSAVTGGGLTWQRIVRQNTQRGTAEIWRAFTTTSLSNVTVTANLSPSVPSAITVLTLAGADSGGTAGSGAIGASTSASGGRGVPTASLTTTRANSWVIGVGTDTSTSTARTLGADQLLVRQQLASSAADTYWVQRRGTLQPAATSVTINDTAPTGNRWDLSLVEVLAAPQVDGTAPTISVTAPVAGSTVSGQSVSLSATATDEVGVVDVQFLLDGAALGSADPTAPYGLIWDTSAVANGAHSISARARDGAGNVTTSASVSVVVSNDTSAPTVSVDAPSAGTVSGAVGLTASATDDVGVIGVQFLLDGVALGSEIPAGPYTTTWDSATATNGSHSIAARARDAAGNQTTSQTVVVTVANGDTTVPSATVTAPASGATVTGAAVSLTATATDNIGIAGVQFLIDDIAVGGEDTTAPYAATWNSTTASNGSHTITARARDAAGNTGVSAGVTVTVNNDVTGPTVSLSSPAAGSTVTGTTAVTATATDNVAVVGVQFLLDGAALGIEDTTSPYSVSWTTASSTNGSHTLSARARDAAGNQTLSALVTVTVSNDAVAPSVAVTSPVAGATVSGTTTVSGTATDNVGVLGVQFLLDGTALGAEDTTAPYSVSWTTTSSTNGTHSITARARDAAGNQTVSGAVAVTVSNDAVAPSVTVTAPAAGSTVSGTTTVSATATDNVGVVGVQFLLDGTTLGAEDTTSPYSASWTTTSSTNGTHTITARARDAAGNQTTSSPVAATVSNGAGGGTAGLAIDATAFGDRSTRATTIATSSFSTTIAGELLLAFVAADDVSAGGQSVSAISGGGLTWQLVRRTNTRRGTSEIWRTYAPSVLSNTTITATLAQSAAASMTVVSFKGADPSGTSGSGAIGATGSGNAATGSPSASLTATRSGSWVFGVGNDWDSAASHTVGGSQTMVHQYLASVGDAFWVQRTNAASGSAGTLVTINDTSPTVDQWNLTLVEVLPASSVANATAPSVSITSPAGGATFVGGTVITVTAAASDNIAIAGVQFFVDGANVGAEDTTNPYSGTWTASTPGSHTVSAIARDSSGNTTASSPVTIAVAADTTAPSVSVTAPAAGATVSANATLTATASDNVSVAGLQFLVDGVPAGAEDVTSPYGVLWNSAAVANGSHTITAVARDAAGNQTASAPISIVVSNDATSPSVFLTAPAAGSTVSGTSLTVSAAASDDIAVAGVQFLIDGGALGIEDTTAPFAITWNTGTVTNGVHSLAARARDAAGNQTTSAAVSVTVSNATPPPTVSVTSPANGASVAGTFTISASATNALGVQFQVDGVNVGDEDTISPYSVSVSASNGSHVLTAVARNAIGSTTVSAGVTVSANTGSATTLTMNGAQVFQTMTGLGVNLNSLSWKDGELKPALDMLVDDLHVTSWRVVFDMEDWEDPNDNADPNVADSAYFAQIYGGAKFQNLWGTLQYLNSKGITTNIAVSFMGRVPTWMGGTQILSQNEDEWVEMMATFVDYAKNVANVQFDMLDPMNETDHDGIEGPQVGSAQYVRLLRRLSVRLDAIGQTSLRFLGPNTANVSSGVGSYMPAMLADSVVASRVTHIALHDYSANTGGAYTAIKQSSKPSADLWMTEFSIMSDVLSLLGQNAAGLQMWDAYDSVYNHAILAGRGSVAPNDAGNAPALLAYNSSSGVYTPRLGYYQAKQLFRFVPLNSTRIGTSISNPSLTVLAFRDPVSGRVTIVGRNSSASAIVVSGSSTSFAGSALRFYSTSGTGSSNFIRGADAVVTNGSFVFSAPANAIFTLTTLP